MPYPAVLPALAVILGIAIGAEWLASATWPIVTTALAGAAACLAWRRESARGVLVATLVGFASAGSAFGVLAIAAARHPPLVEFFDEYRNQHGESDWPLAIEGTLREDAAPTPYGAAMLVDVRRVRTPCGWMPAAGGVRLAVSGTLAAGALDDWRGGRRIEVPATLRRPVPFRNAGLSDEQRSLERRGVALVASAKSAALVTIMGRGSAPAEAAAAVRAHVRRRLFELLPDRAQARGIIAAILVGDRGGLDPRTERRLQEAGTYHVIAISGGNVAILAGVCFLLMRLLRVPARPGAVGLAVLLCAYGYVAGGGASVARATIAAVVYLLARAVDHRTPSLNVLAVVALVAVVYEPLEVFDPALALSYGATLALLVGADRMTRRLLSPPARRALPADGSTQLCRGRDLARRLVRLIVTGALAVLVGTVCAEIALFPVGAYVFHRVTAAGFLLNFAAIPLMTIAQIAGMLAIGIAPLGAWPGNVAANVAAWAADGLVSSTAALDVAPWMTWRVPSPATVFLILYYGGWTVWLAARRLPAMRRLAIIPIAVAAMVIASPWPASRLVPLLRDTRTLRVVFFDVAEGDSALVVFPGGTSLLVDAGGIPGSTFDVGDRVITPALLAAGVRRLDYVAISHADPDHVGGARSIVHDFTPVELWEGVPVPPNEAMREVLLEAWRHGAVVRQVRTDDRVLAGGVELRAFHPTEPDWERQRVRNDDSIVVELRYGDVSIVLTGDAGELVEPQLAPRVPPARVRVLKVAHHGSATATTDAWLDALRPSAVVISCGRGNRYGHPAPSTLQRIVRHGAQIFRTDEDGQITVTTDGQSVNISTFTRRSERVP